MEELGQESIKHGEQLKTLFKEVEKLNDKMNAIEQLTLSVQRLAGSVEQIAKNQSEYKESAQKMSEKISELESNPYKEKAEMYNKIVWAVLSLVIGAIGGYLLKSLFGI